MCESMVEVRQVDSFKNVFYIPTDEPLNLGTEYQKSHLKKGTFELSTSEC